LFAVDELFAGGGGDGHYFGGGVSPFGDPNFGVNESVTIDV
jgi:hypothetical protein